MFENLQVERQTTTTVVTVKEQGNPFSLKAVVGTVDGVFVGASFIEAFRDDKPISTGVHCSDYGVEHLYEGEDADKLTEICQKLSRGIEEEFGVNFLVREAPTQTEPVPPVNESEE